MPGKARIIGSCNNPVKVPEPIRILKTDHIFSDSPDAGNPACICSRCGQKISDVPVGIILAWPDEGGEYRFHPECLIKLEEDENES